MVFCYFKNSHSFIFFNLILVEFWPLGLWRMNLCFCNVLLFQKYLFRQKIRRTSLEENVLYSTSRNEGLNMHVFHQINTAPPLGICGNSFRQNNLAWFLASLYFKKWIAAAEEKSEKSMLLLLGRCNNTVWVSKSLMLKNSSPQLSFSKLQLYMNVVSTSITST